MPPETDACRSEPQCKVDFPYFGQGSCPLPKSEFQASGGDGGSGGGCAVDPAVYPNATFPDEETLKVALTFLSKASAQRNATGKPFWLGPSCLRNSIQSRVLAVRRAHS